jgi:hypothetical protein
MPRVLLAAALAGVLAAGVALPAVAAPPEDPKTTTDLRCVVVAYALTQNPDPELQKLGSVSLFYFWGRLEGRGAADNMAARLTEEAGKMNGDDIKTQAKTCGAIFDASTESLRALNNAVQDQTGAAPPTR